MSATSSTLVLSNWKQLLTREKAPVQEMLRVMVCIDSLSGKYTRGQSTTKNRGGVHPTWMQREYALEQPAATGRGYALGRRGCRPEMNVNYAHQACDPSHMAPPRQPLDWTCSLQASRHLNFFLPTLTCVNTVTVLQATTLELLQGGHTLQYIDDVSELPGANAGHSQGAECS